MDCKSVVSYLKEMTAAPMGMIVRSKQPGFFWSETGLFKKNGDREASLAFSILMTKKYFGDLCDCNLSKSIQNHATRLTSEPVSISASQKRMLEIAVDELVLESHFDKYKKCASSIALPNKSYLGMSRGSGGLHDHIVGHSNQTDFEETLTDCPTGIWEEIVEDYLNNPSTVEARYVGGPLKQRGVTINHPAHFLLKGIQLCLHSGLKKNKKLQFIGKPINDRDLPLFNEDDLLVSGDYEAAKDNFSPEATRYVWDLIEKKINGRVPEHILEIARKSLNSQIIKFPGLDPVQQTRGQLMGQLLSFPILCIINYSGWRTNSNKSESDCSINGDDILFGSDSKKIKFNKWATSCKKLGMVPSLGKCYIHKKYCTMNSELFAARPIGNNKKSLRRVPFIHSGLLRMPSDDSPGQLHNFVKDFERGFANRLTVFFINFYGLFGENNPTENKVVRPIFGHVSHGALGATLPPNVDLEFVYRCKTKTQYSYLAAKMEVRSERRIVKRDTDNVFRESVKRVTENVTDPLIIKALVARRAQFEVKRSWGGEYNIKKNGRTGYRERDVRPGENGILLSKFSSLKTININLPKNRDFTLAKEKAVMSKDVDDKNPCHVFDGGYKKASYHKCLRFLRGLAKRAPKLNLIDIRLE